MQFSKNSKKYFTKQLTHNISNYFTFNIKELQHAANKIQQYPPSCSKCSFPKFSLYQKLCLNCSAQLQSEPLPQVVPQEKKKPKKISLSSQGVVVQVKQQQNQKNAFPKNYHYSQSKQQKKKPSKCMMLCVDLSGSMCISYPTKYKKVNKQFVSKIIGADNFAQLSKLGEDKVIANYQIFQTLLAQGQTPRNIIQMFKSEANRGNSQQNMSSSSQVIEEYITRKQIVGAGITQFLKILKARQPQTYFTIVYFNNDIQIPIHGFTANQIIGGLQNKTIEQVFELGQQYAQKISINKSKQIGDNIIKNYIQSNQNGQTAMTPALVFCMGLAKKMGHTLNQIFVVTDGYSNIGFGQTQNQMETEQTTKLYETLAINYAKPNNCVIDFMTFEDCSIGYDILDQMVGITGGMATFVTFSEVAGQKIVTDQSISQMTLNISESFGNSSQRLCFGTKIMIGCNNDKLKLRIPGQLTPFIQAQNGNKYLLNLGIKSPKYQFKIYFQLLQPTPTQKKAIKQEECQEQQIVQKVQETQEKKDQQQFQDKNITMTVVVTYERKRKEIKVLQTGKVMVVKGSEEQTCREQAKILTKQIQQKLQPFYQDFEADLGEFNEIKQKIRKNEKIMNQMDPDLVNKFESRAQYLQQFNNKIDKLKKDQMSMKSRTYKTYKARDDSDDSDGSDDGFK